MLSSRSFTSTVKAAIHDKTRTSLHNDFILPRMKERNLNVHRSMNNIPPPEYIVDHSTRTTYLKGKFLGKGGFARVHELTDLTTNKVYAGKIIPKSRITKQHHREKIIREIELHRTLKHENIVRFHHFFEDEENVYIILENCPRKSLVHVLKHRRTLSEPEVRYYIKQLVAGVQYIHSQKVIHRDLKLGNMLLSEDLVVKIGDFGLAARLDQISSEKVSVCGTPNYISPEVLDKQGHGYGADVWAIGCIIYAMLVGQPPFETSTLKETYSRIANNKYVIPPLISNDARSLIINLLHPDPNQRLDLTSVLNHKFFTRGYTPEFLPPSSCVSLPKFPFSTVISKSVTASQELSAQPNSLTSELRKFTRTVSQLCLSGARNEAKLNSKEKNQPKKKENSFHCSIRHKLNTVLGTSKKPKILTPAILYEHLSNGLDAMSESSTKCMGNGDNANVLFVIKWIDYSNKYGFGFQLSDQSVGVLFNDGSKISYSPDRSRVEFYDCDGKLMVHSSSSVPVSAHDSYTLLKYFAKYMDENLTEGGTLLSSECKRSDLIPVMQRWVRTTKAIMMLLSSGTVQVNFFKDHTKIIISDSIQGLLVTFIDENRESKTYLLSELVEDGCPSSIYQRLMHVRSMLRDFAQLESTDV